MPFSKVFSAAVLLATLPTVFSYGTLTLVNNCNFPVYLSVVDQQSTGNVITMNKGDKWGPTEYSNPNDGWSYKIHTDANPKPVQAEVTLGGDPGTNAPNGKVNWDTSIINGDPFKQYGTLFAPSMNGVDIKTQAGSSSCKPVVCPAVNDGSDCAMAYVNPSDPRTMVCSDSTDLTFTVCTDVVDLISKRDVHRHHARHMPKL